MFCEQKTRREVTDRRQTNAQFFFFEDLDILAVKAGTDPSQAVLAKRLISAGKQIEGQLIGDSLVVATLQDRLGLSLKSLGFAADAIDLHEQALDTRKSMLQADHLDTLTSVSNLGIAYDAAGQSRKAVPLLKHAFELIEAKLGPEDLFTLTSMSNLANAYKNAGELN